MAKVGDLVRLIESDVAPNHIGKVGIVVAARGDRLQVAFTPEGFRGEMLALTGGEVEMVWSRPVHAEFDR